MRRLPQWVAATSVGGVVNCTVKLTALELTLALQAPTVNLYMAWNISSAIYLQEFSVAAKELTPTGLFFKPDGTKMYTIGEDGDTVDEYNLSSAWDVSTAVYLQEFSVAAKETSPTGLFFKPDGTKMYTIGYNGDTVDEYNLSSAWDVSTAVYFQEFSVVAKEIASTGLFFKPDGTKMYTVGAAGDTVDEYNLSSAWDVSTAVYLQEFSVAAKEIAPHDVFFKPDGMKMYTIGADGDAVDEYDLGSAWDVSTAVYLQEFSVAAKELTPTGLFFKPDGTKMYTIGADDDTIDEYDLLPGYVTIETITLALTLTLNAPTVKSDITVILSTLELLFALQTPTVKPDIDVILTAIELSLTLNDPTALPLQTVEITALDLTSTLYDPSIISSPTVEVSALALIFTLNAPYVNTGCLVEISVLSLNLTLNDPTVATIVIVQLSMLSLSLSLIEPSFAFVNMNQTYRGLAPASDGDLNLGNLTYRWKDGYFAGLVLSLPIADPHEVGRLWNNAGVATISSG